MQAAQTRKKLIYVEVRNVDERISRTQSKQNLNTVILISQKKKRDMALFDKVWYERRGKILNQEEYDGFQVSGPNMQIVSSSSKDDYLRATSEL